MIDFHLLAAVAVFGFIFVAAGGLAGVLLGGRREDKVKRAKSEVIIYLRIWMRAGMEDQIAAIGAAARASRWMEKVQHSLILARAPAWQVPTATDTGAIG